MILGLGLAPLGLSANALSSVHHTHCGQLIPTFAVNYDNEDRALSQPVIFESRTKTVSELAENIQTRPQRSSSLSSPRGYPKPLHADQISGSATTPDALVAAAAISKNPRSALGGCQTQLHHGQGSHGVFWGSKWTDQTRPTTIWWSPLRR